MKTFQFLISLLAGTAMLLLATGQISAQNAVIEGSGAELWEKLNATEQSSGTSVANQQFESLSPSDQQAVIDFMSDVTVVSEESIPVPLAEDMSPQAAGCWGWDRTATATGWGGAVFFRYTQHIEWCSTGSSFYNLYCDAYGWDTGWGWSWDDHVTYCSLSNNGYAFTYFSQGHFCAGTNWGCPEDALPWVRQGADVVGNWWSEVGE